jgi:hypothetical protein
VENKTGVTNQSQVSKLHFNDIMYRSPVGDFPIFMTHLENLLQFLYNLKMDLIICGDINIDYLQVSNRVNSFSGGFLRSMSHCKGEFPFLLLAFKVPVPASAVVRPEQFRALSPAYTVLSRNISVLHLPLNGFTHEILHILFVLCTVFVACAMYLLLVLCIIYRLYLTLDYFVLRCRTAG